MTLKNIEEQIAIIQAVAKKANSSKESATAFLRNAGIIESDAALNKIATQQSVPFESKSDVGVLNRTTQAAARISGTVRFNDKKKAN